MKTRRQLVLAGPLAVMAGIAARSAQGAEKSAADMARELPDPNTSLPFPIDDVSYKGNLPDADSQSAYRLSFQPSIPYPIGERVDKTNFFLRPLISVYFDQPFPTVKGSLVGPDEIRFDDTEIELGDISLDAAIGKTFNDVVRVIGGACGYFA